MATMKTSTVSVPLYGHGLECVGSIDHEPHVTGAFSAETTTGSDGVEYAVFTVSDTAPNLPQWAGTYRIRVDRLRAAQLNFLFAD